MDLFAARYMTRFHCLGGDCEDTCCQDWRIVVDKEHHDLMAERMASPAERAEHAAAFRKLPDGDGGHTYALIVLGEDGRCRLLGSTGLCSIHGRYGEEALANSCAMYPRVIGRIGTRVELVGTASCPEIARQLLLHDDGAELVPAEPALFGRGMISRVVEPVSGDDYGRTFLPVRGLVLGLLRHRRYPVASRLYFVAVLAAKVGAMLRVGAGPLDAARLQQVGRALQIPAALDHLHAEVATRRVDDPFGISVVRALLRLPAPMVPKALQRLLDEVAPRYGVPFDGDVRALHDAYRDLPELAADQAAGLDLYVERYAVNHLLRDWYVRSPSFVGYVHGLLARVAMIRFLVRSLAAGLDVTAFDALVVRVVYALSRMLEHDEPLASQLIRELEEQGLTKLAHAVCLTKV